MSEGSQRVAVVSGAASGIGAATAVRLGRAGYAVVCVDLDLDGAESVAAEIDAEGSGSRALRADVSDDDACRLAIATAAGLGALAAVFNVAGISPYRSSITEVSPAEWDRVLAVNLRSIYSMSRHAVPELRRGGGGVIVNTASVHAFANHPGNAPYAASKGAVVALTRQMAIDLAGDGIRVVAVAPGSVDTPMSRRAEEETGRSLAEMGFSFEPNAVGRVGQAAEVAAAMTWLASGEASFVNGTTLVVDGGLLAQLTAAGAMS